MDDSTQSTECWVGVTCCTLETMRHEDFSIPHTIYDSIRCHIRTSCDTQ